MGCGKKMTQLVDPRTVGRAFHRTVKEVVHNTFNPNDLKDDFLSNPAIYLAGPHGTLTKHGMYGDQGVKGVDKYNKVVSPVALPIVGAVLSVIPYTAPIGYGILAGSIGGTAGALSSGSSWTDESTRVASAKGGVIGGAAGYAGAAAGGAAGGSMAGAGYGATSTALVSGAAGGAAGGMVGGAIGYGFEGNSAGAVSGSLTGATIGATVGYNAGQNAWIDNANAGVDIGPPRPNVTLYDSAMKAFLDAGLSIAMGGSQQQSLPMGQMPEMPEMPEMSVSNLYQNVATDTSLPKSSLSAEDSLAPADEEEAPLEDVSAGWNRDSGALFGGIDELVKLSGIQMENPDIRKRTKAGISNELLLKNGATIGA